MLTQIKLKNFKIFKEETTFPLAKINLLTGINGRGKSSLLQSLLLMRQSIEFDEYTENIILNGNIVQLGNYDDTKNKELSTDTPVDICFKLKLGISTFNMDISLGKDRYNEQTAKILSVCFQSDNGAIKIRNHDYSIENCEILKYHYLGLENKVNKVFIQKESGESLEEIFEHSHILKHLVPQHFSIGSFGIEYYNGEYQDGKTFYPVNLFINRFFIPHYISADRLGPQNFYMKNNSLQRKIDKNGNYTLDIVTKKKEVEVHKILRIGKESDKDLYSKILIDQVGEWLSKILDTPNISVLIDDKSNDFIITLNFKIGTKEFKPSNVGFGYSYILPIIVSGLIAREGEILIVENPEAHLHPRAQSRLTEFLAKVASCGVQVFVESHSEHILHGLQIAVKSEEIELTHEDVSVLYFHEKENGYFTQIPIKPNGKIEKWVEGFFDQAEKDLDTILGL
ncbi:MAG: DUF3696 domain-containing protein [Bacteroidetes bacterium]|nr:MAG: DUF3696 domain-containing protein [Bacteroidota bacterium]